MTEYVHKISAEETRKIARFLKLLAIGMVLFVLVIVLLFVTADRWLMLISPESERRFIEPYIEWSRDSLLIQADEDVQIYVESLATELYSQLDNDQPIRVQVIEGDTLNAFATLGGYIFVFEGLVEALGNENALAMVLGHEIAHVHHRDPLLSTGRGILVQLAISSLTGGDVDPNNLDAGSDILLNRYSREQELAADALALSLLQERYGHVGGARQLFRIIDDESIDSLEFLSTHPDTDSRIEAIDSVSDANDWTSADPLPYPDSVREALSSTL